MASLAEIRKKYPQYNDLSDKDFADAFHQKFYPDMSKGDFYKAVGYKEGWKEWMARGVDNAGREIQTTEGIKNLALGGLKGVSDLIDGGAQLLGRGVAGVTGYVAPGSAADQWAQSELKKTEAYNQDREDRYQAATKDSVMAGTGRVGGNVVTALVPGLGASKVTQAATLPSKMVAGAATGAKAGAVQPVYNTEDGGYLGPKALQLGAGAGLGASAPVVSRVAREALAKTGDNPVGRWANSSLVDERGRAVFGNSPTPAADAQVVVDWSNLKNDPIRFRNSTGGQAQIGRQESNNIGQDYVKEVSDLLKQYNVKDTEINRILAKKSVTLGDIESLRGTPEGDAAASALLLKFRGDAMSKPAPASPFLAPLRRGLDFVTPKALAPVKDALLGGRATGEVLIDKMSDPRTVQAAEKLLQTQQSPKGDIGILRQLVEEKAAERQAQMAAKAAEAEAERGILSSVVDKVGAAPNRSGVLQNFEQGFGLKPEEMNAVLDKLVTDHPEMQKIVDKLRTPNARFDSKAFYDLQRVLETATGKQFTSASPIGQATAGAGGPLNNVSRAVYALDDATLQQLLGRNTDTLGASLANPKGYLTTRASRALETLNNGGNVPQEDVGLLKALGLIQ